MTFSREEKNSGSKLKNGGGKSKRANTVRSKPLTLPLPLPFPIPPPPIEFSFKSRDKSPQTAVQIPKPPPIEKNLFANANQVSSFHKALFPKDYIEL